MVPWSNPPVIKSAMIASDSSNGPGSDPVVSGSKATKSAPTAVSLMKNTFEKSVLNGKTFAKPKI